MLGRPLRTQPSRSRETLGTASTVPCSLSSESQGTRGRGGGGGAGGSSSGDSSPEPCIESAPTAESQDEKEERYTQRGWVETVKGGGEGEEQEEEEE